MGAIVVSVDGQSIDEMTELAIESNATDVSQISETLYELTTEATELNNVAQNAKELGLELVCLDKDQFQLAYRTDTVKLEVELQYRPKERMTITDDVHRQLRDLIEGLECDADVTRVTTNVEDID